MHVQAMMIMCVCVHAISHPSIQSAASLGRAEEDGGIRVMPGNDPTSANCLHSIMLIKPHSEWMIIRFVPTYTISPGERLWPYLNQIANCLHSMGL